MKKWCQKQIKLNSENKFIIREKKNDKSTFQNLPEEVKTKTTLVRIENEGCRALFHSSPNLTKVEIRPREVPPLGDDYQPRGHCRRL